MTTTDDRIRGQVAQVLNARELVINRGSNDGVQIGMRFAVLNRHGSDIRDPESGEVLGSVEVEKAVVKIVRVQERLAVGRTFRTLRTTGGPLSSFAETMEMLSRPTRVQTESLKAAGKEDRLELPAEESLIRVGDPVVETRGDEYQTEGDTVKPIEKGDDA